MCCHLLVFHVTTCCHTALVLVESTDNRPTVFDLQLDVLDRVMDYWSGDPCSIPRKVIFFFLNKRNLIFFYVLINNCSVLIPFTFSCYKLSQVRYLYTFCNSLIEVRKVRLGIKNITFNYVFQPSLSSCIT